MLGGCSLHGAMKIDWSAQKREADLRQAAWDSWTARRMARGDFAVIKLDATGCAWRDCDWRQVVFGFCCCYWKSNVGHGTGRTTLVSCLPPDLRRHVQENPCHDYPRILLQQASYPRAHSVPEISPSGSPYEHDTHRQPLPL